jgi:hypothetical protein
LVPLQLAPVMTAADLQWRQCPPWSRVPLSVELNLDTSVPRVRPFCLRRPPGKADLIGGGWPNLPPSVDQHSWPGRISSRTKRLRRIECVRSIELARPKLVAEAAAAHDYKPTTQSLAARSPARVTVHHPFRGPSAIQPCPSAYARADASSVPRNDTFKATRQTQAFTTSVLEFAPAASMALRSRMAFARSTRKDS